MVCHKLQTLARLILLAAIIRGAATNSQVQLTSTLNQGRFACPGQLVTFTCKIQHGALVLAWRSTEYIGTDLQLELTHEEINHTVHSGAHPTTEVVIVKKKGNRITESKLHLVVLPDVPLATVTCVDMGHNESSISFKLLALPNMIQNVIVSKATPLPQTNSCIVTMQWTAPNNSNDTIVKHYIIDYPLGSFSTADGSTNNARLLMDDCEALVNFTTHAADVCNRDGAKISSYIKYGVLNWSTTAEMLHSTATNVGIFAVTNGQRNTGDVNCGKYKKTGGIVGFILGLCSLVLGITTILLSIYLRKEIKKNRLHSQTAKEKGVSETHEEITSHLEMGRIESLRMKWKGRKSRSLPAAHFNEEMVPLSQDVEHIANT